MALSNWDTLAVNEKGKSTNGEFISPLGVAVTIYKNWLYVSDPTAWQEHGPYMHPTVMQIQEGELRYKDVNIRAIRGPKNGVYCVVWSVKYPPPLAANCEKCGTAKDEFSHKKECPDNAELVRIAMIGIGCAGFDDDGNWIGIEPAEVRFLTDWVRHSEEVESYLVASDQDENGNWTRRKEPYTYTDYNFDESWIREIPLENAVRFNQGDGYFADHGVGDPQATKPGEAKTPIIMAMLGDATESK